MFCWFQVFLNELLTWITLLGCSLSIISLFICIYVFTAIPGMIKTPGCQIWFMRFERAYLDYNNQVKLSQLVEQYRKRKHKLDVATLLYKSFPHSYIRHIFCFEIFFLSCRLSNFHECAYDVQKIFLIPFLKLICTCHLPVIFVICNLIT